MVVFSSLSTLCVFQWITLGWFRNSKSFGTACDISGRVQLKMTSRHQMSWKYIILSVCISLAASRFIKIIPADRGVNMEAIVIDQIIWHLLGCEPSEIRKCLHWSQWFGPPEWTWACLHFYLKVSCQTKLVQQIDRLCTDDQIGSGLKTEFILSMCDTKMLGCASIHICICTWWDDMFLQIPRQSLGDVPCKFLPPQKPLQKRRINVSLYQPCHFQEITPETGKEDSCLN